MNQATLISIVIPVYNASQYLNECIDSILVQTYQNFEIILVDDGSTDNSIEIIKSYKDERICLIRNKHNYIQSLNIGMTKAKGKYIARMDSDDIMMPNRLKLQYNYMEEHPEVDVCGGAARTFGAKEYDINVSTIEKEILSNLIFGNVLIHPTVFMKKSLINLFPQKNGVYKCYNPDYIYAEDYNLWVDLAIIGRKLGNVPDIVLNYRTGEHQVTNKKKEEMSLCSIQITIKYMEHIIELITKSQKQYSNVFNNLSILHYENHISFNSIQQIISIIHKDYLKIIQSE